MENSECDGEEATGREAKFRAYMGSREGRKHRACLELDTFQSLKGTFQAGILQHPTGPMTAPTFLLGSPLRLYQRVNAFPVALDSFHLNPSAPDRISLRISLN